MTATEWVMHKAQKRMRLVAAYQADPMAAWTLSLERGAMLDQMAGRSVSSCACQRRRRPGIWYPHLLTGVLFCISEGMGAGMAGSGAWSISCVGACLGRGVGWRNDRMAYLPAALQGGFLDIDGSDGEDALGLHNCTFTYPVQEWGHLLRHSCLRGS